MNQAPPLNELGILQGSDKSSLGHDYLRHYERVFAGLRTEAFNLIEFGVGRGGSLRMWAEYFPRAVIVGVDSSDGCQAHATGRCIVEAGSQSDAPFLRRLGELYRPTIVLDGGSHRADEIVTTFRQIYPLLLPGGYYAVECLHFHAGGGAAHWRGTAAAPPQDYFLQLARLTACPQGEEPFDRMLAAMTDRVEFFHGGAVVRRKSEQSPTDLIATHRRLAEQANQPVMWRNYSLLVLNNGGDPHEAVAACRRAIALDGSESTHHHQLSHALERAGDVPGAIRACRWAIRLHPTFTMFRRRLENLERLADAGPRRNA
jgi:hypothetical protein